MFTSIHTRFTSIHTLLHTIRTLFTTIRRHSRALFAHYSRRFTSVHVGSRRFHAGSRRFTQLQAWFAHIMDRYGPCKSRWVSDFRLLGVLANYDLRARASPRTLGVGRLHRSHSLFAVIHNHSRRVASVNICERVIDPPPLSHVHVSRFVSSLSPPAPPRYLPPHPRPRPGKREGGREPCSVPAVPMRANVAWHEHHARAPTQGLVSSIGLRRRRR